MLMLSLDDTVDQLAMAYSAHWHGHMLRREYSCLEKGTSLKLRVKGQK